MRMGADYSEAVRRIGSDERIRKYLGIMRKDDSIVGLRAAFMAGDIESAFRAAHTVKGSALNLGLSRLADCSTRLADALRSKSPDEAVAPLLEETERVHEETMACIEELLGPAKEERS